MEMSVYSATLTAYEANQTYVMFASVAFTLSTVLGWFLLPKVFPVKFVLPARIGYVLMCVVLYAIMIAWFVRVYLKARGWG